MVSNVGLNFIVNRGGKLVKSLLCTKPQKITSVKGLTFASGLKCDTLEIKNFVNLEKTYSQIDKKTFSNLLKERPWIKSLREDKYEFLTYNDLFVGHCFGDSPNEVVNTYLRAGKIHPKWNQEEIDEIINSAHYAMSKSKLPKNTVLYRRVDNFDNIPDIGKAFTDRGFVSASINDDCISGYGGKLVEICVPKDTPCIANGSYFEILLENGLTFEVLEKSENYVKLLCRKTGLNTNFNPSIICKYEDNVVLQSEEWIRKFVSK